MSTLLCSRHGCLSNAANYLLRPSTPISIGITIPYRSLATAKRRPSTQHGKTNKKPNRKFAPSTNPKPKKHKLPKEKLLPSTSRFIPPALLLPTASPFAYVSMAAFEGEDDPRPLAKTLFEDVVNYSEEQLPPFQGLNFEYFSPKSFQHELPRAIEGGRYIPEVAFLGRSNVGKSSLINALMQRDLAVCSKHPGRTQQPYYYGLLSKDSSLSEPMSAAAFLVDLPGYGYANAPVPNVEEWTESTQGFLRNRRDAGSLQRLFLLIDARRGISRDSSSASLDLSVMQWLDEEEIPYSIVVTKADCVGQPQLIKVANEACLRFQQQKQEVLDQIEEGVDPDDVEPYGSMGPVVYLTSAKKKEGIPELRSAVEAEFYVMD